MYIEEVRGQTAPQRGRGGPVMADRTSSDLTRGTRTVSSDGVVAGVSGAERLRAPLPARRFTRESDAF